ncbi:hypothetical protein SMD11_0136 [Streptomyces albireticuli]|uniref:Uncharacterized protein n=1 Tax=Streptomyces albireticuli TaxID=1940 RepID=A0A1Z2KUT1_9ACTN|nr:hypothetical protein SMD11_0136 [Streptomyces albireticuli]
MRHTENTQTAITERDILVGGLRVQAGYEELASLVSTLWPDRHESGPSPGGTLVKIRCMRRTLHLWPADQAADAHTATPRLRLGATLATARRHDLNQTGLQRWRQRAVDALAGGARSPGEFRQPTTGGTAQEVANSLMNAHAPAWSTAPPASVGVTSNLSAMPPTLCARLRGAGLALAHLGALTRGSPPVAWSGPFGICGVGMVLLFRY